MVNMTISIDEKEVKRRLGLLAGESGKVIARAVNRTYPTAKKAIAKEAKAAYLITQKEVNDKKTLRIVRARQDNPVATLTYSGRHRNLYLWNNKKAVTPNRIISWKGGKPNTKVYKAAVQRGRGRSKLGGTNKPFIQRVRSGESSEFVGLFRRVTSAKNAPLVGVSAPAIPQILKNDKIMAQFEREAGPMLQKRLEHEIDAILKGVTK